MNKLDELFAVPDRTARPLRILAFAPAKKGKSHFCFTATDVGPLYWIDTERGSDFYDPTSNHGFKANHSVDPRVALEAIKAASSTPVQSAVAIDSMSSVWFEQQEVAERVTQGSKQSAKRASFRAWAVAKRPLTRLYNLMMGTQCHIIITARQKEDYEVNRKGEPTLLGIKPDVEKGLEHAVDVVLHMGIDKLSMGTKPKPENFWARVVGTRAAPGSPIQIGDVFRNPKFSDFLALQMEGVAPTEVRHSAAEQAERAINAPQGWTELLQRTLSLKAGWTADVVRGLLKEEFGSFDAEATADYYDWLVEKAKEDE
jgi:hypothetical protein